MGMLGFGTSGSMGLETALSSAAALATLLASSCFLELKQILSFNVQLLCYIVQTRHEYFKAWEINE
jgi:hypothetical protein